MSFKEYMPLFGPRLAKFAISCTVSLKCMAGCLVSSNNCFKLQKVRLSNRPNNLSVNCAFSIFSAFGFVTPPSANRTKFERFGNGAILAASAPTTD